MTNKVLITGASGFVGYHLVRKAKSAGCTVCAAVRASSNIDRIKEYVDEFVVLDYSDIDSLRRQLSEGRFDYIIHAAALTKAKSFDELYRVNVKQTADLIKAAFSCDYPPQHINFVSSLAAIGPISFDAATPITEEAAYHPITDYGKSKREAELLLREQFADRPISVFRPTAVYGPNDKDIFILIKTLHQGLDPYIGPKEQKLSFIYVEDLSDILVDSLSYPSDDLQFYNLSDGEVYSRYAMADFYKEIERKRPIRLHVPYWTVQKAAELMRWMYRNSSETPTLYPERLGELTAENWSVDTSKATQELGFKPQYKLKEGLAKSIAWYKANNWL